MAWKGWIPAAFLAAVGLVVVHDLTRPLSAPPPPRETPSTPAAPTYQTATDPRAAAEWLDAVERDDVDTALRRAETLAPRDTWPTVRPGYAAQFSAEGVDPGFLQAAFGREDFQSWSHALFFARLAREVAGAAEDPFPAIFRAVTERLAPVDPEGSEVLWPFRIWQLRRGLCDRQAWVLCELLHQRGVDAKIVYLRDPKTLVSPHTVAQVRLGSRSLVADPLSRRFLEAASAADLAQRPERAAALWPDHPPWQAAAQAAQLWVAAYPQDYCPRNQALSARIRAALGAAAPRFGEDPFARLAPAEALPCALWFYPIRLLAAERSAPNGSKRGAAS